MKVKDLIQKLSCYNPEWNVLISYVDYHNGYAYGDFIEPEIIETNISKTISISNYQYDNVIVIK